MIDGHIIVNIGGKEVGLRFTMWAVEKMNEIQLPKPESTLWKSVAMVSAGYFNNCRIEKLPFELTTDDFENYVDELYSSADGEQVMKDIVKTLSKTYVYKSLTGTLDKEEEKKSI